MRYTTVLIDLDHTLFDSDASEAAAFADVAAAFDVDRVDDVDRVFDRYTEINRSMWRAVEHSTMQPGEVRVARFEQLVSEFGIDADPAALADTFVRGLGRHGDLYDGAMRILDELAGRAGLALVTNGLSEVQNARIERLGIGGFFDAVVISSEIGAAKPHPAIFERTFDLLDRPSPHSALMVGDSLGSDIRGGRGYGIATCWFNRFGDVANGDVKPTHDIRRLDELTDLVPMSGRSHSD